MVMSQVEDSAEALEAHKSVHTTELWPFALKAVGKPGRVLKAGSRNHHEGGQEHFLAESKILRGNAHGDRKSKRKR